MLHCFRIEKYIYIFFTNYNVGYIYAVLRDGGSSCSYFLVFLFREPRHHHHHNSHHGGPLVFRAYFVCVCVGSWTRFGDFQVCCRHCAFLFYFTIRGDNEHNQNCCSESFFFPFLYAKLVFLFMEKTIPKKDFFLPLHNCAWISSRAWRFQQQFNNYRSALLISRAFFFLENIHRRVFGMIESSNVQSLNC